MWVGNPSEACMSVVSAVCLQVEVSATSWSLVQGSPTECDVSLCVIYKPREWGGPGPLGAVAPNKQQESTTVTQHDHSWTKRRVSEPWISAARSSETALYILTFRTLMLHLYINLTFIGPCIITIVEERKTNLMSLAIFFSLMRSTCFGH